MREILPRYYAESKVVDNLTKREANEISQLYAAVQDLINQFFVDTASWGLRRWEEVCGIPYESGKPDDQRKSVIKTKLRGAGTITLDVIKSVADSYENGEIMLEENFANYEVIITFIGKRGIPGNVNDLRTALRDIVPAHLNITFEYTYLRWEELDAAALSWDQLEALNMSWDELEVWKPDRASASRKGNHHA